MCLAVLLILSNLYTNSFLCKNKYIELERRRYLAIIKLYIKVKRFQLHNGNCVEVRLRNSFKK